MYWLIFFFSRVNFPVLQLYREHYLKTQYIIMSFSDHLLIKKNLQYQVLPSVKVVIVLQYINILKQHVVHLKLHNVLYMSTISQKNLKIKTVYVEKNTYSTRENSFVKRILQDYIIFVKFHIKLKKIRESFLTQVKLIISIIIFVMKRNFSEK